MKFKKCKYLIATHGGTQEVEGYAVLSELPVHFAVREISPGYWRPDHWDTGNSIAMAWGRTRQQAADNCVARLREKIASGAFQKALDAAIERSPIACRSPA